MGEAAVETRGLTRAFDGFVAVDHLDLTVERGRVFGFLGPNGAGKTTAIRMLCGILRPTAGTGRVAGFDLLREAETLKASIGYMSQRFSLYEELSVLENLRFFAGIYGLGGARRRERIAWAIGMAGLEGREGAFAHELAGGWRQRLALGCAILHEPAILFLDEPTSGVDPASRRAFWELIGTLAERGITVFVTTHYMDEAEHCDELALIYGGRLVASGSPDALKQAAHTAGLLELECSDVMRAYALVRKAPGVAGAALFGRSLHVALEEPETGGGALVARLEAAGIRVETLRPIRPSLEDAFVALIEASESDRAPGR